MKGFADFGGRMIYSDKTPVITALRNLKRKSNNYIDIKYLSLDLSKGFYI